MAGRQRVPMTMMERGEGTSDALSCPVVAARPMEVSELQSDRKDDGTLHLPLRVVLLVCVYAVGDIYHSDPIRPDPIYAHSIDGAPAKGKRETTP
jgi:hypothetical protein